MKVADGVISTSELVNNTLGSANPALGEDAFQRIIKEKHDANIMFLIQQANIRSSELKTAKEFNKEVANIVERCFHRIATTYFVRDSLIVSFYFFSLEHSTLSFSFTAIPFQNRSNFYYSFFLEILFREFTINGSRNFTTYCFQHLWSNSEVVR